MFKFSYKDSPFSFSSVSIAWLPGCVAGWGGEKEGMRKRGREGGKKRGKEEKSALNL